MLKELVVILGHTEVGDLTKRDLSCGKNTDNYLFAVNHRKRGYTDIKRCSVNYLRETSVLRDSLFGAIHAAYELETSGERAVNGT